MAFTEVQNLPTICPIDNPMVIKLSTDNGVSTAGVQAKLYLKFTATCTDAGKNIVLRWNGETYTFTTRVSPDDSGEEIHTATGGQSLADWLAVLIDDLNCNYYLSKDFIIEISGYDTLKFTAKLSGSVYTIEWIDNPGAIPNMTDDPEAVPGIDEVTRNFYAVILQVKSADYVTTQGEDSVAPDQNGLSTFDIHDLLCDYLIPEFEWPHENGMNHHPRANFIKEFVVKYGETYDREYYKMNSLSGTHYAILGGFDYKILAALNGIAYTLTDFLISFKAFLTWHPLIKKITTTQRDKLFYLVFGDHSDIFSFVKLYYTDGTNGNATQITTFKCNQYEVHEFFTDYISLDIANKIAQGKTLLKYDFWLQDEHAAIISQVRTFEIEFRTQPFSRIFIFRNSFGAYDVFRASGRKKHINKYERMILERNLSEYTLTQQYQILESESFHVSSGYVSKSTKNWLRELMLSEEVFEIIDDSKFPILIQNEEVTNIDDLETIYDVDIVYKYAFKNQKYSELSNTMPLLAENLNILLNEDGQSLFA